MVYSQTFKHKGLSKKETCLRGRVAEINFGRCLPMSTTLAAATRSKPSYYNNISL